MPDRLDYEKVELTGPRWAELVQALQDTHICWGVLTARFVARTNEPLDLGERCSIHLWLKESFKDLFDTDAARNALPDLQLRDPWPQSDPPHFDQTYAGSLGLGASWHTPSCGAAHMSAIQARSAKLKPLPMRQWRN